MLEKDGDSNRNIHIRGVKNEWKCERDNVRVRVHMRVHGKEEGGMQVLLDYH